MYQIDNATKNSLSEPIFYLPYQLSIFRLLIIQKIHLLLFYNKLPELIIMYVPSYFDIEGNEEVHKCARSANVPIKLYFLFTSDIKNILKQMQQVRRS